MVNDKGGFTLVELIVAMTLFTVAVLAVMGNMASLIGLVSAGDRVATATFYAQDRLETLQATDCASLGDGSETQAEMYSLAWTVTTVGNGRMEQVQLLVTYPSAPGMSRVDTLETSVLCVN